jgi:hypothetical protein
MILGDEGLQSRSELDHDPAASVVALDATKNIESLIADCWDDPGRTSCDDATAPRSQGTLLNTS